MPPAGRRRRKKGPSASHYGAPALFLLAVTIAVLLIRSGLGGGSGSGTATTRSGPVTHPSTAPTPPPGTTRQGATTTTSGRFYTVAAGDTFGSISAKTGVPIAQLEQLNPGVNSNSLQVGQKLRVK